MENQAHDSVVIVSAVRTPIGAFMGSLSGQPAAKLGAHAIKKALETINLKPDSVDEVIMGQVLQAGAGQAPARQAMIYAGIPHSARALTINKVCGSGLKAVMLGADAIALGHSAVVVAGGQENMSLAPHLLENSRAGYKMGEVKMADALMKDGLQDPYSGLAMGNISELCAKQYQFTREAQDEYATESYKKAIKAQSSGHFVKEIAPYTYDDRRGPVTVSVDETPTAMKLDAISSLRPAFEKTGTITAANASKINDGASALVLMSESKAKLLGVKPLAKIVAQASFAQDPNWFTTAPTGAIKAVLKKANLNLSDIDLFEINEAFALVTMVAMKDLNISKDRVNVYGGAVALGHPIGASGARVLTTLVHALHSTHQKKGLATLCIGGGEAVAVIIEKIQ